MPHPQDRQRGGHERQDELNRALTDNDARERRFVDHVQPSGVEVAELDFGDGAGSLLVRRDEHRGSAVDAGGTLRIEMIGWALELEPEHG